MRQRPSSKYQLLVNCRLLFLPPSRSLLRRPRHTGQINVLYVIVSQNHPVGTEAGELEWRRGILLMRGKPTSFS